MLITLLTAYSMKLYMVFKLLNFVVCFVHFLYILCLFVIFNFFIGVFSFLFLLFMVIFEGSNLLNCYFLTWFKAEVESCR